MKTLLVVFFYVNGQPAIQDGFHPIVTDSAAECEAHRQRAVAYFERAMGDSVEYTVACYTQQPIGSPT